MYSKLTKRNSSFTLICVALLASIWARFADMYDLGSVLKNIRFLAPLILIPIYFKKSQISYIREVHPYFSKLFTFFFVIIGYTIVSNALVFDLGFTYRNLVNLILLLSPLIISDAISRSTTMEEHEKTIHFLFYCYTIVFFLQLAKDGISLSSILTVFNSNIVTDSEFETESDVSLVLGPYALFFLHYRKKTLAAFSILLTIIAAKRVAILGLGASIFVFYFIYPILFRIRSSNYRKNIAILFSVLGVFAASVWGLVISGKYNQDIENLTGLSVNRFLMGRMTRFELVFSKITEYPITGFGYGLGYIENILYYKANFPSAFHNDFYRLFLEFGPILFGIWIFISILYTSVNRLTFSCIVLLFLLMQTDNVFMYDRVMYSIYIISAYSLKNRYFQEESVKKRKSKISIDGH